LLAGEFLRECKPFIEEGVHPQIIIRSFRLAVSSAIQHLKKIAVTLDKNDPEKLRELLQRCAATTLNSKVIVVVLSVVNAITVGLPPKGFLFKACGRCCHDAWREFAFEHDWHEEGPGWSP
jgi:hypothetical protein